jgi:hypothetical protein
MKFHAEFDIKKLPQPVAHAQKMLLIGSCFTENIGEKLLRYKFDVLQNPNGILFNPVSVANALINYIDNRPIDTNDLFQYNEAWHSWDHHSRFSALSAEAAVEGINASTQAAHDYLKQADHVLITLGSAWTYTLTEKAAGQARGRVAANNHKAPADWFQRRLMTPEEVLQVLDTMMHRLFHFNPDVKIIFTISPVRHLREGAVENNRSKAVLIQAVHHLVDKFDRLYYFPAYELVIDDLRDYRFYAEDLVHPNYAATQYVWEKFMDACMDERTKKLIAELHAIHLAYHHKAFNPGSLQHKNFLQSFHQRTTALQQTYPYLNLTPELTYFNTPHE